MAVEAVLARVMRAERRALSLTCPRCGRAPLFRGWFRMNVVCAACDLRFERAQGYWVGAIYVNYGVTVAIAVGGFFLLREWPGLETPGEMGLWVVFVIALLVCLFRCMVSMW